MPDQEYTPGELLDMSESDARDTLTVDQFERWKKINELHADAEDTREQWADQQEQVDDIVVRADPKSLGTEFDLYGNDVIVHFSSDDERVRDLQEQADGRLDDHDVDDPSELPQDAIDAVAGDILDLLDIMLLVWNGNDWSDLPEDTRQNVLETARQKWGIDDLYLGVTEAAYAIAEEREDRVDVIDSFRGARGRGNR